MTMVEIGSGARTESARPPEKQWNMDNDGCRRGYRKPEDERDFRGDEQRA